MNQEDPMHREGPMDQEGRRDSAPIHLLVQSDPEGLADLQARLLSLCTQAGLDDMAAFKLTSAIVEALNNCIEHAYGGETGHPIDLIWTKNPGEVAIEIRDQGHPMPDLAADASPMPGSDAESGRGWHIIREWTDSVSYTRETQENVLTLTHRLP
ncbi:MAG: ATP-binding protein [Chromatiaceae bacterium]